MTDTPSNKLDPIEIVEYNADFSTRVVIRPSDFSWVKTTMPGVEFKLFEACYQPYPRRTLLLRCMPGSVIDVQDASSEVEFFVLDGQITDDQGEYPVGTYVRNPEGSTHASSEAGCSLFVKLSQIHEDDQQHRIINTHRESRWLPGPEEGTLIYPLHMWDSESIFLIQWINATSVKPSLNPRGEEIFVVEGELQDRFGRYPAGSWIRNPPEAWETWKANAGTLIYYKNGHFPKGSPDTPDERWQLPRAKS